MRQRLPLILSATALALSVLGTTPLGHAAGVALTRAAPVPLAKFAINAGLLNGHKSAVVAKAGQIPVVGANGHLNAAIMAAGTPGPTGPAGPSGPTGPVGITNVVVRTAQTASSTTVTCNPGEKAIAGGYQGLANGRAYSDRPDPAAGPPTGWHVESTSSTDAVRAYVVCIS
jgi:hypothetical protein